MLSPTSPRHSRQLEKTYRRTQSAEDRLAWVQHERKRHAIHRQKEFAYWNLCLSSNAASVPQEIVEYVKFADGVEEIWTAVNAFSHGAATARLF